VEKKLISHVVIGGGEGLHMYIVFNIGRVHYCFPAEIYICLPLTNSRTLGMT